MQLQKKSSTEEKAENVYSPPGTLESYTYLFSTLNADYQPNLSFMTPYNSTVMKKGNKNKVLSTSINDMKPYSNLCGLFAVLDLDLLHSINRGCQNVIKRAPPSFD